MQNRGILIMLRAAAIVVIATGVNDVIASAVPRYEPLYLFLAAVALVSLLDGVIAGLAAAILSVAFHALLFMPRGDAFSTRILVPAGVAVAVAIAASVIRGLIRARRRVAEPAPLIPARPPLLETSTVAHVTSNNEEVLAAIDDLRGELRAAISDLGTSRSREDALAEELRYATRRALEAERVLHHLREESSSMSSRVTELAAETATERAIRERLESEAIALREQLAAAPAADASRIAELERLLAEVRAAAGAQSSRVAERDRALHAERARRERLESEAATRIAELERAVDDERESRERAEGEAAALAGQVAAGSLRAAELERAVNDERAIRERVEGQAATVAERHAADAARIAELERAIAEERATRERLEREAATRVEQQAVVAARIADLERATNDERATRERLESEAVALAEQRAADAARVADLERSISEECATRERLESEAAALAEQHATDVARIAEFERAVNDEHVTRERLESEATTLAEQRTADAASIADLERAVAEEQATRERLESEAATLAERRAADVARIADLERAVTDERATRERLERDATTTAEELAAERAERAAETAQFDAKLQTIVTHLASDHEADLGQALSDKEEARAEARALALKLAALQRTYDEERAARAAETAQFDTKLQTIVTHLASDHEADLGQALSDKEEARAEARALAMKLAVLQRRHDEDRSTSEALLAETRAAALAEIVRLRGQLAPKTAGARPRILVVHPDAELRTAAAATLERAGYEVVGAADGLEALRVAIAAQPVLVIAESSMPKMDGRELCQVMKSQEKTAHIRFVLLCRATDPEVPRGDLLPDEVLRKPVPVETLKATLASLLAPTNTH